MHVRIAAGVCALSTGILIVGPAAAMASADPGSDGTSTHGAGVSNPTSPVKPAPDPFSSISEALRKALQDTTQNAINGVTGTLNSFAASGANGKPPKVIVGNAPALREDSGSGPSGTELLPDGGAPTPPNEITPTSPEQTVPASSVTVPSPPSDVVPTPSGSNNPPPPAADLASALPAPPTTLPAVLGPKPVPTLPNVMVPISNVIAALANSIALTPALIASLPTSPNPILDVITALQSALTSVVTAGTPLIQLPADISSLLGFPPVVPGATTGVSVVGNGHVGSSIATGPPMPGPIVPFPGFDVGSAPSVFAGPAVPLDVPFVGASSEGVTGSATAEATPATGESSVMSIVESVIGAVVATVSLAALAAVALPGILGLLGTCAAGVRIGYRQAKAGSELPATAVSRFVGSGPVGVVRSGSQISLRPRLVRASTRHARTPRIDAPATSSAGSASLRLLDRAV